MKRNTLSLTVAIVTMSLSACGGSDGLNGVDGIDGINGVDSANGSSGENGQNGSVDQMVSMVLTEAIALMATPAQQVTYPPVCAVLQLRPWVQSLPVCMLIATALFS